MYMHRGISTFGAFIYSVVKCTCQICQCHEFNLYWTSQIDSVTIRYSIVVDIQSQLLISIILLLRVGLTRCRLGSIVKFVLKVMRSQKRVHFALKIIFQ